MRGPRILPSVASAPVPAQLRAGPAGCHYGTINGRAKVPVSVHTQCEHALQIARLSPDKSHDRIAQDVT
jgi:hypothetical protein